MFLQEMNICCIGILTASLCLFLANSVEGGQYGQGIVSGDLTRIFNAIEKSAQHQSKRFFTSPKTELEDSTPNPCEIYPCFVAASCEAEEEKCVCKKGYFSPEEFQGECHESSCYSSPCLNGGSCISEGNGFTCNCVVGFEGEFCEEEVVPCIIDPASDKEQVQDGVCEANTCEASSKETPIQDINACKRPIDDKRCKYNRKNECQNDGKMICFRSNNECGFRCECEPGFTGDTCQKTKNHEDGLTCENNGVKNEEGKCNCENTDYTGVRCQLRKYQSYMHFPRVHFSGLFKADVPTVNNLIENFDTENFSVHDAEQTNDGQQGSWNPSGSGNFRIFNASVTRVCNSKGNCHSNSTQDNMVGAEIKDGDFRAVPKMADIDVIVEGLTTEIWGLVFHVSGFFKGNFQPTSCRYVWEKRRVVKSTPGSGTKYQSVLTNVVFSNNLDTSQSEVGKEMKNLLNSKRELSISFNLDMFDKTIGGRNYSYGRLVGAIGISGQDSPPYFTFGRLLEPFFSDKQKNDKEHDVWFTPFTFEKSKAKLFMDFGNSLQIDRDGDILESLIGKLEIGYVKTGCWFPCLCCWFPCLCCPVEWIADLNVERSTYENNSGIVEVNVGSAYLDTIENVQMVLLKKNNDGCPTVLLREGQNGINIQPFSRWTLREQPKTNVTVQLMITQYGKKFNDSDIATNLKFESFNASDKHPSGDISEKDISVKNNGNKVDVTLTLPDPKHVRRYKDGQVYALYYYYINKPSLENNESETDVFLQRAILVFVWDVFIPPEDTEITWVSHVKPIFTLYANLFPVMTINFMNLGNYFEVKKHSHRIRKTMMLPFDDPNFMPVTRDLSPCKTKMIVEWLNTTEKYYINPNITEQPITIDTLKRLLQTALQLEHATIPPYLSGYLSIKNGQNQEVKNILRDVLLDEMYHLAQVSNLINAVGGRPNLLQPDFILSYPGYLPGGCHPHVSITINKISLHQIQNVYMEIEKPFLELKENGITELIDYLHKNMPRMFGTKENCETRMKNLFQEREKKVTNHNTIGELYTAIIYVLMFLSKCGEDNEIFRDNLGTQLSQDNIIPNGETNKLFKVTNFSTALHAIRMITHQGEGASPCNPMQVNNENYKHLSHYYAFSSIVNKRYVKKINTIKEQPNKAAEKNKVCEGNFDYLGKHLPFFQEGVWPIVNDPKMSKYKKDGPAYRLSKEFNEVYIRLLGTLQNAFDGNVEKFDESFGLMKTLMVIGEHLVRTPINEEDDPNVGPNAGPTYRNDN